MHTYTLIRKLSQLAILSAILSIAACTGDDLTGTPADNNTTTTDDGGSTGGDSTTTSTVRIGSTITSTFTDGALLATPSTISAGGTSIISVEMVDETGAPVTTSNTVIFSSPCVTGGTAIFSNPTFLTTNGTATTNYTAQGCVGSDVVTATLNGTTQTASGNVTVASATVGLIEHTLNDPSLIALAGTGTGLGLPETSIVSFTVKDGLGLPVQGADVTFSLNSVIGGITLSDTTVTSDSSGLVFTTVQSGSVATNVRVTATLDSDPLIQTVSSTIAIATGPAAQNNMSIGATELNPLAWNVFNKTVSISVLLGDRFSNLISDGTIVSFRTELGTIDANCTTVGGGCSVNWHSGSPQTNSLPGPVFGAPGVTTILAFVEGEESFVDLDFNGVFSDGDGFTGIGFDLEEAFRDDNDNGTFDSGEDNVDFNSNVAHDGPSGLYNGKGCTHSALCDPIDAINIWKSIRLVVAEQTPDIIAVGINGTPVCDDNGTPTCANPDLAYPAVYDTASGDSSLTFTIGGITNQQVLPVGSVVKFSVDNGKITAGASQTVLNSNGAADSYTVFIASDGTPSVGGFLSIEVTVDGVPYSFTPIEVRD